MERLPRPEILELKAKLIIFVGAGSSPEKRDIYATAKELGVRSVILDGAGSWGTSMCEDGTIAAFFPVAFDEDDDATLANMLEAVNKVREQVGEPDGVATFMEIAVPIATRLAAKLGVPANPIEAVMNARDKHATRRISAAAGLPTPKHASIEGVSDLKPAADEVGFPAVLKPVGMFQSMGVVIVDSMSKLVEAYDTVLRELAEARAAATSTDDYRLTVARLGVKMVLEEFLDGEEQVVDIVMQDGECVYASVTDNWAATTSFFDCQGKFNETGASSPSVLTAAQQAELIGLGVASTKALGFQLGVFCLNLKYTSRGARLIEINSRMGGMFVRDHNRLCWGVDLVVEHLLATVGLRCRPPKASEPLCASAGIYVSAEASGVVTQTDVLAQYAQLAQLAKAPDASKGGVEQPLDFAYFKPLVARGERVLGPRDAADFPSWLCGFMLHAPTPQDAITRAMALNHDIVRRVGIEPAQ